MKLTNKTGSEIILGAYHNGRYQVGMRIVRPGEVIELSDEERAMFPHSRLAEVKAEPASALVVAAPVEPPKAPEPTDAEKESATLIALLRQANAAPEGQGEGAPAPTGL